MPEKSGYEIREGLLHLAYQIVVTNAQGQMAATSKGKGEPGAWTGFTVQDVISAARELNAFVSEKPTPAATVVTVKKPNKTLEQ